ncbi:hypothetical protein [Sphingobacterium detergens]|uniref:Uncharacterized protein n=1 Tax=Sphingobacterium detergens TaxID=1145106 RepID=A0A420ARS2_SPHD1|nr:hypothetical protein [Sphingobacterium detergens]RKE47181.1 hypothetical protein DFQ12_4345 [Sphingobacterium detergens]
MIQLFKKRPKGNAQIKDKIAHVVAACLVRVQQSWAGWMNRQSDRCNPKLRGAILIIFLMAMAAIGITMIMGGFKSSYKIIAGTGAISMPTVKQAEQKHVKANKADETLQRIEKFRLYLDSLSKTEEGKIKLESINLLRPGLRDSIKMVERIYKQQQ